MNTTLLKLQIGPVQEFIAQARSTRDLWSGSYLLSWMSGHVICRLREVDPTAEIVFPRFAEKPSAMLEWIRSSKSRRAESGKDATIPTVPNQLLARVTPTFGEADIQQVLGPVFNWDWGGRCSSGGGQRSEWRRICDKCLHFLREKENDLRRELRPTPDKSFEELDRDLNLWERQLRDFWQVHWLLWPGEVGGLDRLTIRRLFSATPMGRLWEAASAAATPNDWMMHYQVASHRFEARHRTRDFCAWDGVSRIEKDSLSGKEEALTTKQWYAQIPRGKAGKDIELNHLFRNNDPLAAPNLVKRVWHKAYLEAPTADGGMGLKKREPVGEPGSYFDMPSVPGVAAFPWARDIWAGPEDAAFKKFWPAVEALDDHLSLELPKRHEWRDEGAKDWLARVDWAVFREEFWQGQVIQAREAKQQEWIEVANAGLEAVGKFLRERHCGRPSSYYAVLAGDGDNTGRWLAGIDSVGKPFDFDQKFHGDLSASVAGFAAENTRTIVEDILREGLTEEHCQGKLIYAGGEDVLAIVPADQAIECACLLQARYQKLMPHRPGAPFTYSVGIAIGHIREPLQDMVEAARDAERQAKKDAREGGFGRNALALTLFKRSGETAQWGARFDSKAFELLSFFRPLYRTSVKEPEETMPITGRFPHRLIQALARFGAESILTLSLAETVAAEVDWVIRRQTRKGKGAETGERLRELRKNLKDRCGAYLQELIAHGRPLREFYQFFAVEAFIARQGG